MQQLVIIKSYPSLLFTKQFLKSTNSWDESFHLLENNIISPDEFCILYNRIFFPTNLLFSTIILFSFVDSPVEMQHCFLNHWTGYVKKQ